MKFGHYLTARVLCSKTDTVALSTSLKRLLGCGIEKDVVVTIDSSDDDAPALVHSFLKKETDINHFFKFLVKQFPVQDKQTILQEIDSRVDDHLDFFLRIDKMEWLTHERVSLTSSGDCFHLTFAMAAYPKSKERAIALVKEIFKT